MSEFGLPPTEPIRVSWSKIRVYGECKQRGYLHSQGKRHGAADARGFFRGTVVDVTMRKWLELANPQPGMMAEMVRQTLTEEEEHENQEGDRVVKWKHANDREESIEWCARLGNELEPILQELILPYEYEVGKRFEIPVKVPWLDGKTETIIVLNGEMDLLARNAEGEYMCWDLKGTENNQYWKKVMGQLVFYDIATAAMFGKYCKITGLIQPLATPKVMPFVFEKNDYQNMWQRIMEYVTAMWRQSPEDIAPNSDNVLCTWCEEKFACQKFKPVKQGKHRIMTGLQAPKLRKGVEDAK